MAYARLSTGYWHAVRDLGDDAKLLGAYLRSCTHRNRLGCYVLDPLYAAGDLQWSGERVERAMSELKAAGNVMWDAHNRTVLVPDTLAVDPLANENVAKGAIRELESVPDTELFVSVLETVMAAQSEAVRAGKQGGHYDVVLEAIRVRIGSPDQKGPPVPPNPSTDGSGNGSTDRSGNGRSPSLSQPNQALPSQTLPIQAKPDGRDVEHGLETWKAIKGVVLEKWHLGSEEIALNGGNPIGMGAEMANVMELVEAHGAEETVAAINIGPALFKFTEPHSLRWYTSREHGSANFHQAVGAWRKRGTGSALGRGDFPRPERHRGAQPVHVE